MSLCEPVSSSAGTTRPSDTALPHLPVALCRRILRQVLNRALGTPSDFEAFLIDYFPEVHRQTGAAMDREQKLNLLLVRVKEELLTELLQREFPQLVEEELLHAELAKLAAHELREEKRRRFVIILSATIEETDRHKVEALLRHLRRYTDDSELTIEDVKSGSVILICTGAEFAFHKIFEDYVVGKLPSLLGMSILTVYPLHQEPGQVPLLRAQHQMPDRMMPFVEDSQSLTCRMVSRQSVQPIGGVKTSSIMLGEPMSMSELRPLDATLKLRGRRPWLWSKSILTSLCAAACVMMLVFSGIEHRSKSRLATDHDWSQEAARPPLPTAHSDDGDANAPQLSVLPSQVKEEPEPPPEQAAVRAGSPAPRAAQSARSRDRIEATCRKGTRCERATAIQAVEGCLRDLAEPAQLARMEGEVWLARSGSRYVTRSSGLQSGSQKRWTDSLQECVTQKLSHSAGPSRRWPQTIRVKEKWSHEPL